MKKSYILSIVACMLLAVSYTNAQGPFYPTIDTYIFQSQATTAMNSTNPGTLEARKASSSNERITFIEFNIGSSNTLISKAELNLWLYETANAANSETASLYEVTTGTFSNATTWNNIGAYTLSTALSSNTITTTGPTSQPNTTANGWYKFDITNLYNRVAGEAGADKKIKLCLKALNANLVLRFSSSETTLGSQYRPYLSTVPVSANVPVTGVSVSPGSASVGVGATTSLTATIAPADATNKTVTWSSSNNAIATVSGGVVTGVAVGDATITATTVDGGFSSTSLISVINIPVTGVSVTPNPTTVVAGAYIPLTATVAPATATNKTVIWSTSNNAVAIVSASGVVTGMAAGSATITATTQDGSFTSTSVVTVNTPAANYALNSGFEANGAPATSPTNWFEWTGSANNYIINSNVVAGNVGLGDAVGGTPRTGTYYLSIAPTVTWPTTYDVLNKQDLTGLPNGTYTLKAWFRGNGGSGYFNNGGTYSNFAFPMNQWTQKVINNINVSNGTTTINIQYNSTGGYELDIDDVELTLNQFVLVTGINAISPATKTLSLNETATLTTTTIPGNASNSTINWTSSNTSVATVSAAGLVTAVSAGTATIAATTSEGGFTTTSTITVLANYVLNPGFEANAAPATSATSWAEWSATTAYTDNSNVITGNVGLGDVVGGTPHSGSYYVEVAPTVANATAYGLLNYQTVNLPNGTYTLTGWFRGNGGSGYLSVNGVYNNFNFANLSQWTQLAINNVVISTGTCQVQINYTADNGQKLDIDDIQLRPAITISGTQTSSALTNANADVSVSSTGDLTIDASRTVQNISVAGGGKVTLNSGVTLNVTNFTLNSDATGNGTFLDLNATGGLTVNGTTIVNQNLASYRSWYMSSPIAGAQPTGMNRIKYYNEADNTWPTLYNSGVTGGQTAVPYSSNSFVTGAGYLIVPDADDTNIQFIGTGNGKLNTGVKEITLKKTTNATKTGFNLIGNPYPSYLDWTTVYTANSSKLSDATMWYRTKVGAEYKFWTVTGGGVGSPTEASNSIPPMQAFWVRTAANNNVLTLNKDMRAHAPATYKSLKAPAAKNTEMTLLRLQVSNGTNTDEAVIYFSSNASNERDAFDAPKMSNENAAIPEIYTTVGTEQLVINGMKTIPMDQEIGLGFVAGNAAAFSLKANEVSNLPANIKVIVKDNVTNAETDITDGVSAYEFTPLATTGNRFSVIFRTAGAVTGLDKQSDSKLLVYSTNNKQITVVCNDELNIGSTIAIYNAVGQKLLNKELSGSITQIEGNFTAGVYVVKVNNITKKVIVK